MRCINNLQGELRSLRWKGGEKSFDKEAWKSFHLSGGFGSAGQESVSGGALATPPGPGQASLQARSHRFPPAPFVSDLSAPLQANAPARKSQRCSRALALCPYPEGRRSGLASKFGRRNG